MAEFARRQVGRTGLSVTELGLGCATLGGSRIDVARQTGADVVNSREWPERRSLVKDGASARARARGWR